MDTVPAPQAGSGNVRMPGFDVNAPVFVVSSVVTVAFILAALVFRERAAELLGGLRVDITTQFDWVFMGVGNLLFLFCLFLVLSPLGRVRLGGARARPEYSRSAWFSMLFTAGVAIGLLFYGVLEPVYYYRKPPLGIDPADTEAARAIGISASTFHWGLSAWSFYATVGLSLAFFAYNRGLPLTIRSAFQPLFGERVWGWPGHVVDVLAIFATLFGLATSLGIGAGQAVAGLNYLFGVPSNEFAQVAFIVVVTACATISVLAGIDVGIKRLSQFNALLALALALFVLAAGPTLYIFDGLRAGLVDYAAKFVPLSNWVGRRDLDFMHGWTTFYWAWWIAWAPAVGMFIARVSKGRTIREFVIGVLLLPTLCCLLWMGIFGGTALHQFIVEGYTGVTEAIAAWRPELVLFKMLERLPLAGLISFASVILLMVFFITSSDSASLVVNNISAGGKLGTPRAQHVFWCGLEGLVAIALLLGGGLTSLQAASLITGLPFAFVLLGMMVCVWMALRREARA